MAALREASETPYYKDDDALWVTLVVAEAADGPPPDTAGPGGFAGTSVTVTR